MSERVAIIGCGLIGQKRAAHLPEGSVTMVCDVNLEKAQSLAGRLPGAVACDSAEKGATSDAVDVVMIATLNDSLPRIAEWAIGAGKHVLIEKPGALDSATLRRLEELSISKGVRVRVGYNHRYHPACLKALEIIASGVIGPLMFLRARYGHGGRVGYDREWRADPALSGGGELIDQGVHLIDLAAMFLGEFTKVEGHADTYFWDMPVDDNAFLSLRTASGQTAWLHASCSEWKNLFSMEIYGRYGKLHWEGLGGSYGVERLTHYQMLPAMGPPDTVVYEYPRGDASWKIEMDEFFRDIREGRVPTPGLKEAAAALEVVEHVYRKSGFVAGRRQGKPVG